MTVKEALAWLRDNGWNTVLFCRWPHAHFCSAHQSQFAVTDEQGWKTGPEADSDEDAVNGLVEALRQS